MKKMMMLFGMFVVISAYAANDDVVNSQMYVDNAVDGLQTNLPAKTSDKVVTYTTTAGTTGERDIKTDLGNESTNQSDTGIPTVGTVNTALDDKQNKLSPLNNVNIVTYTGTNTDSNATNNYYGRGVVTTTPIYDSTVNTFDNGLVRAKTLNDAIIAGVNAEATKIQTSKGALWSFNRTAPKVLPTTANLPANIEGKSFCHWNLSATELTRQGCSDALIQNWHRGDWGVVFSYDTGITYDTTCAYGAYCGKEISGISACYGDDEIDVGTHASPTLADALNTAYIANQNGPVTESNDKNCWCKITNPNVSGLTWVLMDRLPHYLHCLRDCAYRCALFTKLYQNKRAAVFSAVPAE